MVFRLDDCITGQIRHYTALCTVDLCRSSLYGRNRIGEVFNLVVECKSIGVGKVDRSRALGGGISENRPFVIEDVDAYLFEIVRLDEDELDFMRRVIHCANNGFATACGRR